MTKLGRHGRASGIAVPQREPSDSRVRASGSTVGEADVGVEGHDTEAGPTDEARGLTRAKADATPLVAVAIAVEPVAVVAKSAGGGVALEAARVATGLVPTPGTVPVGSARAATATGPSRSRATRAVTGIWCTGAPPAVARQSRALPTT